MGDNELLTAISKMFDEKLEPINEKLTELDNKVTNLDEKVTELDEKVANLDEKVTELDEKVAELDEKVTQFDEKITDFDEKLQALDEKVTMHYDLTVEFYGNQQESNTETNDRLKVIEGELEMHRNQIARNTSDIKWIKKTA